MTIKKAAIRFFKKTFIIENWFIIAPIITVIAIGFCVLFLLGCSKTQDLKIVHNYNNNRRSLEENRKQAYMDVYVYKKFKDVHGKEASLVYRVD